MARSNQRYKGWKGAHTEVMTRKGTSLKTSHGNPKPSSWIFSFSSCYLWNVTRDDPSWHFPQTPDLYNQPQQCLEWFQTEYIPKGIYFCSPAYSHIFQTPFNHQHSIHPFTQTKPLALPSMLLFLPHLTCNALVRPVSSVFRIDLEPNNRFSPFLLSKPNPPSSPAWTPTVTSHTDKHAQQPKWS